MSLTYAEIVDLAGQEAKVPGFTAQAGAHLNMILQDLALNCDFDLMTDETHTVTTGTTPAGEGPYALPADYLRHATDEVLFEINGTPYNLYQKSLAGFKRYSVGPGLGAYPEFFATDYSVPNAPVAYLWPPSKGSYVIEWPYYKKYTFEPDPASSTNIPWFPMSSYLVKELAARLTSGNDDERAMKLSAEAKEMLKDYLLMKDDSGGYPMTVKLDRNSFSSGRGVKGTKLNPWGN
jgi:hypothetical protein